MPILLLSTIGFGNAVAQPYDETTLFSKGAWEVGITVDNSDGEIWCSAATSNREGQTLDVTAFSDSTLMLFVFDNLWNIRERSLTFLVDIDYSRWVMSGQGRGNAVSLRISLDNEATKFMRELMEGNAVAVMNDDGRRLATFSLSGSYASIQKFAECWKRIMAPSGLDPF